MEDDAFDDIPDLHRWNRVPECRYGRSNSAFTSGKSPRHGILKLKRYSTQNDTDVFEKLTYGKDIEDSHDGCGQQIYHVTTSPIEHTCVIYSHDGQHCLAVSEDGQSLQVTTLQDANVNKPEEKTGIEHSSDEQTSGERAVDEFAETKQCTDGEQTVNEDRSDTDVAVCSKNVFKCRRYRVSIWSRKSKGISNPDQFWVCAFKTASLAVNRCIGALKGENSAWTVALLPATGLIDRKGAVLPIDTDPRYFAQKYVQGREGFLAYRSTRLAGEGQLYLAVKNKDIVYFKKISDFDRTVDSCDALFKPEAAKIWMDGVMDLPPEGMNEVGSLSWKGLDACKPCCGNG